MKRMTKEEFISRLYERNPNADNIELLSEFTKLTDKITYRCKLHNFTDTTMARNLVNSITCPECQKSAEKRKPTIANIGEKYGMLTILYRGEDKVTPSGRKLKVWHCRCDCGNECDVRSDMLNGRRGVKSCGCLQKSTISKISKDYNEYVIKGNIAIWKCGNGKSFITDKDDVEMIKNFCWNNDGKYILTHDSATTTLRLHVFLMKDQITEEKCFVDHINGNRFDNRRCNLRVCTREQNSYNTYRKTNTGWQGVNYSNGKYVVKLQYQGDIVYNGEFDNLHEAVEKRIELEDKYYGEFSYYRSRGITFKEKNKTTKVVCVNSSTTINL